MTIAALPFSKTKALEIQMKPTEARKKPSNHESDLQQRCVRWFRYQYPQFKRLMFSIPNGGKRNVITATIMKAEGAVSGVSDLQLAIARHGYHGLFIEMKYGKNNLSESQQDFKSDIEKQGYKHITCWTDDEFIREVSLYLTA